MIAKQNHSTSTRVNNNLKNSPSQSDTHTSPHPNEIRSPGPQAFDNEDFFLAEKRIYIFHSQKDDFILVY